MCEREKQRLQFVKRNRYMRNVKIGNDEDDGKTKDKKIFNIHANISMTNAKKRVLMMNRKWTKR